LKFYKFSLLILLMFFALNLNSHPHLFIEPSLEIELNDNYISGFRVGWKWDYWWSSDVIAACDLNKDFFLDEEEIQLVYQDYFNRIQRVGYFAEIYFDGEFQRIGKVEQFSAKIEGDETVSYSFLFPLNLELEEKVEIKIVFYDRTIFTAFDRDLVLIEHKDLLYENVRITTYSLYGVQVQFKVSLK